MGFKPNYGRDRAERNRAAKSRLRHAIRELRQAVAAKDAERAKVLVPQTISIIDRSAKKGIIAANTAARYKSRLMKRLRSVAAG